MSRKLEYSIKLWKKKKQQVISYYDERKKIIEKEIEYYLCKIGEIDYDIINSYYMISKYYMRYGELKYLVKDDVKEYKKYFYLSAKAADLCINLLNKGIQTFEEVRLKLLSYGGIYATIQAIIAGDNELALQLAGEKSMIGCILLERYEEAPQYTIPYDDDTYVNQSFISVARGDEEMLKKSVESAIKQIRKEARMDVTLIDEYSLAALILARKRGMNFDIHVAEIPEGLLEDTPLDYESLKLPIPEHVQELLEK